MMVGETFADDMNPAMPASYMGDGSDELHLAFDFSTMFLQWDAKKFFNSINSWIKAVPNNGWPCHVFSNHDQPRSMTRFGKRNESESRGKVLAVLLLTLKGTPFLYYGEELGMANRHIPKKHIHDPVGLKYWPIPVGRDGERTPMQWTPGINAGFTAGEPWLPLNNNYTKVNVQAELKDEKSFLNFYKSLIKLRKRNDILAFGSWEPVNKGEDDILSYRRIYDNRELLVILNFSSKLKKKIPVDVANRKVLFSTHRTADSIVGADENYIYPYEATVLM
jgi:alpha-glucosidase